MDVGGEEEAFEFGRLESWVAEHEDNLLRGLSERYTAILREEMAEDNVDDIDMTEAMRRSRVVFDLLWDASQSRRAVLWEQLAGYASVKSREAVALSWEVMTEHTGAADSAAATAYVESLGGRLLTRLDDKDNWDLDWRPGSEALVEVAETYRDGLQEPAVSTLVKLAQRWSGWGSPEEVIARLAVRLLEQVRLLDEDSAGEIVNDWSKRALTHLRDPCLNWLATHFADGLTESQRDELIENLEAVCLDASITEEQGARYRRFVGGLGEEEITSEEMQSHLGRVLGQLAQQHQNPGEYLDRVFAALVPRIAECPASQAGAMLTNLFVSPRVQQPDRFGRLHGQMAEHWPTQDEIGAYDPQAVFANAASVAATHPAEQEASGILRSMHEMVARGIVGGDNAEEVLQTAVQLWSNHTDTALEAILALDVALDADSVVVMATSADLTDEEAVASLSRAWRHEAAVMSFEEYDGVARRILSLQPEGTETDPDLALQLWVDASPDRKQRLLGALLVDPDLNDGQRKRAWRQVSRSLEDLEQAFAISLLPRIFEIADAPEAHRAVLNDAAAVSQLFPSLTEKNELSRTLLEAFAASPSVETKNGIADWMRDIGGGAALRRLGSGIDLSEDDAEILARRFRNAGTLRRYRRRLTGTSSSTPDEE